jgi:hypothetical protein
MGRLHLTEARIVGVVADGRSDSCRGEWVEPILVMVEDVKCLRPELERDSFCEAEVLADTHIPVVNTRPPQEITPCIPKLAGERLTEGNATQICCDASSVRARIDGISRKRVIEPMIDILVESAGIRIADLSTTLREAQQQAASVVTQNRKRKAALERCDRGDLPAADGRIKRSVHIAAKVLAAPDRELIHETIDEPVVNVKIGTAVI